jgi:hypothetical protein
MPRLSKAATFRNLALSLEGAVEQAHHGHPDFRAHGRIFATLAYPDEGWGMVALTPDDQQEHIREYPSVFEPASGAWGRQGATMVRLAAIDQATLCDVLALAWKTAAAKTAAMTRKRRQPAGRKRTPRSRK